MKPNKIIGFIIYCLPIIGTYTYFFIDGGLRAGFCMLGITLACFAVIGSCAYIGERIYDASEKED